MDNPRTRFYLRLAAIGIVALASALQAHLPGLAWKTCSSPSWRLWWP